MPRPRLQPLFQFQGQWIAEESDGSNLYRFWTEPGTGRTRRRTLGTTDLEEAKVRFVAEVMKQSPASSDALLAVILHKYLEALPEKTPKQRRSKNVARGHARKLLAFFGTEAKARSITLDRQRRFIAQCVEKNAHKLSYAARIHTTLHSAFIFSKVTDPEIIYTEPKMEKLWKFSRSEPAKAYVPTDEECLKLLASPRASKAFIRWAIIGLLTTARPEAAVELGIKQFNKVSGTIALLVPGETQNKKYRSIVRAGRVLRFFLRKWQELADGQYEGRYCGYTSVEGVKSAIERTARDTGIPISSYSFRQKATTILRLARVSEDEISVFLGHRRKDMRTTAGYGDWDPDYLLKSAHALDQWMIRMIRLQRQSAARQSVFGGAAELLSAEAA